MIEQEWHAGYQFAGFPAIDEGMLPYWLRRSMSSAEISKFA